VLEFNDDSDDDWRMPAGPQRQYDVSLEVDFSCCVNTQKSSKRVDLERFELSKCFEKEDCYLIIFAFLILPSFATG